jgi:hypothetical protein
VILTQATLAGAGCEGPGCDHTEGEHGIYLHGRCHPGDPARVLYQRGVLTVTCAVGGCGREIARVAVAP